jgi:dTDP-4-dehydrorhamnose reductase
VKVLITGRQGQLVQSLLERGRDSGHELIALGRPELDLEQPGSAAQAVHRVMPDVVVSAAAYTAVDQAEDEPERAHRINGDAAGELAEAAREVGARIIHISTDYVFDGRSPEPYRPGDPVGPLGVYGQSKLKGEEQVRAATPDHLIIRTAWVYSPFGKNFLKTMLSVAQSRDVLTVVGDQRGNPTSALNLADGLLAALAAWARGGDAGLGQTHHLVGTGDASWAEFAQGIFAQCARLGLPHAAVTPIRTSDWPTRAARPAYSMLDCNAFELSFGFRMPAWQQATAELVERLAAQ